MEICSYFLVLTAQGKWSKNDSCKGKHRDFGKVVKTQGISYAPVLNSLVLNINDIVIFAAKFTIFFLKTESVCQVSFEHETVTNHLKPHRENMQLNRENTEFENEL